MKENITEKFTKERRFHLKQSLQKTFRKVYIMDNKDMI